MRIVKKAISFVLVLLLLAASGLPEVPAQAAQNQALGKTVKASSQISGYPASNAVDGNTLTKWSSANTTNQFICVDLGLTNTKINEVKLIWDLAYAKGYDIYIRNTNLNSNSNNNDSWNRLDYSRFAAASGWTKVYSQPNGDGNTDVIPIGDQNARYLAVVCTQMASSSGYSLFEFEVGLNDTTPPTAPPSLTSTLKTINSVSLSWGSSTDFGGVAGYDVYNGSTLVGSTAASTTSYIVTGLFPGTEYTFSVRAKDAAGNLSLPSTVNVSTLNTPNSMFNVLEIQPGRNFELNSSMFGDLNPSITQMSISEFICKVEEVNGKYDIVYVGNLPDANGAGYCEYLSTIPYNLPQGGTNGSDSTERYSGNDITNLAAKKIKSFIESGQLAVFNSGALNTALNNTKLYNNFIGYKDNPAFGNFKTVNSLSGINFKDLYINTSKRPKLKINYASSSKLYDGSDASFNTNERMFALSYDINEAQGADSFTVKLLLDMNGDGIFKDADPASSLKPEFVKSETVAAGSGKSINYRIPDSFIGVMPWKLEITNNRTKAKAYETGYVGYKGINGNLMTIKVLQLTPTGNKLSISSLSDRLKRDGIYDIKVTEMPVQAFDNSYTNNVSEAPKDYNGIPTKLDGNYDMIVLGFNDTYGNGNDNLKKAGAVEAVKRFIASGQSVMFTHDTMTYRVNDTSGWAYNLTRDFRDIIGQNRYLNDPLPQGASKSYGFTRLALDRANNGGTFPYSTTAYKLNDTLFTNFPFVLAQNITVSNTHHQYFQLDLEDEQVVPLYTLQGDSRFNKFDGRNDYYTYSKGNITFSGTGHATPDISTSAIEPLMFVNTIIKASVGANHAPKLTVTGISNGQNFSVTQNRIDFTLIANDPDVGDEYLNAWVYIDSNNNGVYEASEKTALYTVESMNFKNDEMKQVSVDKRVPADISSFKMKIEVSDAKGASSSVEYTLGNKPMPSISVSSPSIKGLTGDAGIAFGYTLTPQSTGLYATYTAITLSSTINSANFTVNPAPGVWTGNGNTYSTNIGSLSFNPAASWDNPVTRDMTLTLKTPGTFTIAGSLKYDEGGAQKSVPLTQAVNVKAGRIYIESVDDKDKRLNITGISISRNGSGFETGISTGNAGLYSSSSLSTAAYGLSVPVLSGNKRLSSIVITPLAGSVPSAWSKNESTGTALIPLSYDTAEVNVKLVYSGEPSLTLSTQVSNALVGDTIPYRLTVGAHAAGFETQFTDLRLNAVLDGSKFTVLHDSSWSADAGSYSSSLGNVTFYSDSTSWSQNKAERELMLALRAAGDYLLGSELKFKAFGAEKSIPPLAPTRLIVKSGEILIDAVDANNNRFSMPFTITKAGGGAQISGQTGTASTYSIKDQSSGAYTVAITHENESKILSDIEVLDMNGMPVTDSSIVSKNVAERKVTIQLSYNYPVYKLNFRYQDRAQSVILSARDNKTVKSVSVVQNGTTQFSSFYDPNSDISLMNLSFNYVTGGAGKAFTAKPIKVLKFNSSSGKWEDHTSQPDLNGNIQNLKAGDKYQIYYSLSVTGLAASGNGTDVNRIRISSISIRFSGKTYNGSWDVYTPLNQVDSTLSINVVEAPKLR